MSLERSNNITHVYLTAQFKVCIPYFFHEEDISNELLCNAFINKEITSTSWSLFIIQKKVLNLPIITRNIEPYTRFICEGSPFTSHLFPPHIINFTFYRPPFRNILSDISGQYFDWIPRHPDECSADFPSSSGRLRSSTSEKNTYTSCYILPIN